MSDRYSARGYGRDYGRYDREDFYGGRYRGGPEYDYERDYAGRGGRDFSDRAGDEVRSWMGDDEAERRRRMDEGRGWREDEGRSWRGGYRGDFGRFGGGGYYGRSYAGFSSERGPSDDSILVKLGDTDFYVPDEEDIRGRRVIDQSGNDIGSVGDLIVDQDRRRVRFLLVTSGGFLGIGGTMLLVPVEAVTDVNRDEVMISRQGGRSAGAPRFNPTLFDRREYGGRYGDYDDRSTALNRSRGRGPRGYKRSDDRIREDLNDRLADDPVIDASDVEVMVSDGEVTLNGTVVSRADKRRAEDLAERVSGVTHVQNNLRMKRGDYGAATGTPTTTSTSTAAGAAATGTSRGTAAGSTSG
jgi:osmotically-inducible protein OsmY/sporulation protein YlmC with PRC-barrel domain